MRSLPLARGQSSCLRFRGSVFQSPSPSSTNSTIFRLWRTNNRRSHTSWKLNTQSHRQGKWQWNVPPFRGRAPLLAAANGAALGTAAFVAISEKDEESGQTAEKRMLEISRAEIAKEVDENDRGLTRVGHNIIYFLDLYIWEPLCTGVRFLHLAAIFVPVILAVPVMWLGKRQKDRDNERSGTLWWYGFLVKGMEWAGPAFIKVRPSHRSLSFSPRERKRERRRSTAPL